MEVSGRHEEGYHQALPDLDPAPPATPPTPLDVTTTASDVSSLLDTLEAALASGARSRIIDGMTQKGSFEEHLRRLRSSMTAHSFGVGGERIEFARLVRRLDQRTRQDGFRVLHAWNHQTHRFTDDIVPALLLDFYGRARGATAPAARVSLQILLDYYFLHLLSLGAMRAWDSPDPNATLDRVTGLVEALQAGEGSGHHFVADAETLLIYALSQFHPEEQAYDRIIEHVRTLDAEHQLAFAEVSVAVLSAHLRWGFWLMYRRDVVKMRDDNVGDYPWLLECVTTLLGAYAASADRGEPATSRSRVLSALLQGLAADPWAFTGKAPAAMSGYEGRHAESRALLARHRERLLDEMREVQPSRDRYSPLALHFNFPHNTLVAIVTLALLEGKPQRIPLNALFAEELAEAPGDDTQEGLARTLMAFSSGSPDRLGYRGAMLVAYDPSSAMRSYSMTADALKKMVG